MIQHEAQMKGAAANRAKARERDELVLRRLAEGASYADLASELETKLDNVRTIVQRARRRSTDEVSKAKATLAALRSASKPEGLAPGGVVRVGQRPAGPMADRRTKRNRDRSTVERNAVSEASS